MRYRHFFTFKVEVPAPTVELAIEHALRLFRPRVRQGLRQTAAYQGSYRGTWFTIQRPEKPPPGRVDLKTKPRRLKKKRRTR